MDMLKRNKSYGYLSNREDCNSRWDVLEKPHSIYERGNKEMNCFYSEVWGNNENMIASVKNSFREAQKFSEKNRKEIGKLIARMSKENSKMKKQSLSNES